MKIFINKLHQSDFFGRIFHTLDYCLKKELSDCETVLDLGCGPNSPIKNISNIKHSVGVEAFSPYLERSKKDNIHSEYVEKRIEEVDFPEDSFDAVILIEVLEHLPEKTGYDILERVKKWAKKKVIVTSPNGFLAQKAIDNNPMQKHLSGWDLKKMERLGFHCRGLAGLKHLRQEVESETMGDDLMTSIRFRPKPIWFGVAAFSQIFVYHVPSIAFELFSIKNIEKKIK